MQKVLLYSFGTLSVFLVAGAVGLSVMHSHQQVEEQGRALGAKTHVSPTSSPVTIAPPETSPIMQPVVLAQDEGTTNTIDTPKKVVIFNNQDLQTLWKELYGSEQTAPPLPVVDFTKNAVVAILSGKHTTGGYELIFNTVSQDNKNTIVQVTEIMPGEKCLLTDTITSPFILIQVPNTGKSFKIAIDSKKNICK